MPRRGGFILVARKMFDGRDELFADEPFGPRAAWLDLIEEAVWKDRTLTVRGIDVPLERGQLLTSHSFLSDRWRWTRSRVRRFLDQLKAAGRLAKVREVPGAGTVYYITAYEDYQPTHQATQEATHPEGASATHPSTAPGPETSGGLSGGGTTSDTPQKTTSDIDSDTPSDTNMNEDKITAPSVGSTSLRSVLPPSVAADAGAAGRVDEALRELASLGNGPDPVPEEQRGEVVQLLVGLWVDMQPLEPSQASRAKQGTAAKRLAGRTSPRRLAMALFGLSRMWEHEKGNPWDLWTLERKFDLALQNAVQEAAGEAKEEELSSRLHETAEEVGDG